MEKTHLTEPKSGFVNVNGIRLHTLDWGGAGEPIVLLHATGFLGRIYRPLTEPLRAIGHVYSFDQRGHGDSAGAPDGNYNWTITMKDLEGFIATMGWRNVRAIGHSAGATAIGGVAAERPDLISPALLGEPVIFEYRPPRRNSAGAIRSSRGRSSASAFSIASGQWSQTLTTSRPTTPGAKTCCST